MIFDIRPLLKSFLSLEAAIMNPAKATSLDLFGLPLVMTGLLLNLLKYFWSLNTMLATLIVTFKLHSVVLASQVMHFES